MSLCLLFEGSDELCGSQWSARMRALTNGAQFGFAFSCGEISAPAARRPASLPLLHGQVPIGWKRGAMGCGAGPRPRLSLVHQTRPYRIELWIAQGLPQVRLVQRTGIVPALPDVTAGVMDGIPIRSISAVGVLQRQAQHVCFRRDGDEMHMVGHQAVAH